MKKSIYFILLTLFSLNTTAQVVSTEIMKTLELFKNGYKNRDTSIVNEWFNSVFYDNVEVIGTFAIEPSKKEWKNNKEESKKIFKSDWTNWGDLSIDLSKVNINYDGNFAWISFPATIKRSPKNSRSRTAKESYANMLKTFSKIIENNNEDTNEKLKLLQMAYYANLLMYQYELGDEYIWPLRITGVLQKKNGNWKFRQMHFSYPNRGFPNVRY